MPAEGDLPPDWDDSPERTEEMHASARPASGVLGPEFSALLMRSEVMRERGRALLACETRRSALDAAILRGLADASAGRVHDLDTVAAELEASYSDDGIAIRNEPDEPAP